MPLSFIKVSPGETIACIEKMGVAHLLVLFVEVRGGCDRETKGFCNPMPQSKPCFFVSFCLNVTIFYTKKSTRHSIKHETSN